MNVDWHGVLIKSSKCTGARHLGIFPLGAISCVADVEFLLDNVVTAIKVQNEKHTSGGLGGGKD